MTPTAPPALLKCRHGLPFGYVAMVRYSNRMHDVHAQAMWTWSVVSGVLEGSHTMSEGADLLGVSSAWVSDLLAACGMRLPRGGWDRIQRMEPSKRHQAGERLELWAKRWRDVTEEQMPLRWRVRNLNGKGVKRPMAKKPMPKGKPKPKGGKKPC